MVANPHEGLTLSLLDYASLSMGLSLHPRRAKEVFASFGLDETSGHREVDAWEAHLAKDPKEAAACAQMRGRMRGHWERWAESNPQHKNRAADVPERVAAGSAHRAVAPIGTLSLLEYASLSMGLELLAHRADDVYGAFGLRTVAAQDAEESAWRKHLERDPVDKAKWKEARERMRDHWRRWDEANPQPTQEIVRKYKPRKEYTPPARFQKKKFVVVDGSKPKPIPTRISLLEYAALSIKLERPHADRRAIFREAGLDDATGPTEIEAWKQRLAGNPAERARFDEVRVDLRNAAKKVVEAKPAEAAVAPSGVHLRAHAAPSTPAPARPPLSLFALAEIVVEREIDPPRAEQLYVHAGLLTDPDRQAAEAPLRAKIAVDQATHHAFEQRCAEHRARRLADLVLGLEDYARLCVELDLNPGRGDAIHGFFGLYDEASRTRVHDVWQSRFEKDQEARKAWFGAMERVRRARAAGAP